MKIAMINGSPKPQASNSSFILEALEPLISTGNEITHYNINKKSLTKEQYTELCLMDTLILAFPLYIDAVPSHLFRMLVDFEEYIKKESKKDIYVYAIANNGFFEGRQNHVAMEIMKNWCIRCGIHFGQGIGLGAGEMLGFTGNVPLGHGPLKNLGRNMEILANNIQTQRIEPSILFSPNLPRFAWRFAATHFFWNATAKKNGLRKKELLKHF